MSQVIRPDDLESGVMFDVAALGTVPLGQSSGTIDVVSLQKPIRELYLNFQKPSGVQPLPSCRLVVSNRGLAVTDAPTGPQDRTPTAETLYNIPSVVFAAAVRFLIVGKKEKDFRCAFEAIDSEGPPPAATKGKAGDNVMYIAIDKKWKYITKVTSHPPICACVIQRMTGGVKASELHAFVCESDLQARDVIFCLTSALRNFTTRELPAVPSASSSSSSGIYGHSPYDLHAQSAMMGGGGMRSDAEQMMLMSQQQQQARPSEGVYGGFQGGHHPADQMMGYRGPDVMSKPGGMRQDLGGPVGGQWDPRTQAGRAPPTGGSSEGQQGSDWLSHQRDQLMRNFTNDQIKNERSQAEQGVYDMQRGVYDMPPPRGIYDLQPSKGIYDLQPSKGIYDAQPSKGIYDSQPSKGIYDTQPSKGIYDSQPSKGIYDTQPSKGIYDSQPSKGIYDTQQSAIYEYRPPQNPVDSLREIYSSGPATDVYSARRDVYDPQLANRGGQGEQGTGNLYGQMRSMSGSSERVFDEPSRRGQDLQKSNYESSQSRMGSGDPYGGGQQPESEYSRGFALPRVKVNYDDQSSNNSRSGGGGGESIPSGGGEYGSRPVSVGGYDSGRLQKPPASSSPYPSLDRRSPLPQVKSKVQPPAPLAKTSRPSATSPPVDPNPRAFGAGGPGPTRQEERGSSPVPVPVTAKRVMGIKVFPTIMLRGNQASAAAAAANDEGRVNGDGAGRQPVKDDHYGQDRRKKDEEIESAFGGISVDPGRAGRNAANDFEQSLGYLP